MIWISCLAVCLLVAAVCLTTSVTQTQRVTNDGDLPLSQGKMYFRSLSRIQNNYKYSDIKFWNISIHLSFPQDAFTLHVMFFAFFFLLLADSTFLSLSLFCTSSSSFFSPLKSHRLVLTPYILPFGSSSCFLLHVSLFLNNFLILIFFLFSPSAQSMFFCFHLCEELFIQFVFSAPTTFRYMTPETCKHSAG